MSFKPVSKAKLMKIDPNATKHIEELPKPTEPDICEKMVFAYLLTQNPCFSSVTTRFRPKQNLETSTKRRHKFCSKMPENRSNLDPEIHLKSLRIRLRAPRCPFCCSLSPPACPQAARIVRSLEILGLPDRHLNCLQKWKTFIKRATSTYWRTTFQLNE